MPRIQYTPPSWLARTLYRFACRLYPRFADPHHNPVPEILVVADGRQGARLLKTVRHLDHISVYWPGRGEMYIAGRPVARITFLSEYAADRLSHDEREQIWCRTLPWGPDALRLGV